MKSEEDIQADIFACCFLMPKERFIQLYRKWHGDLMQLAIEFQVPVKWVKMRYEILKDKYSLEEPKYSDNAYYF